MRERGCVFTVTSYYREVSSVLEAHKAMYTLSLKIDSSSVTAQSVVELLSSISQLYP